MDFPDFIPPFTLNTSQTYHQAQVVFNLQASYPRLTYMPDEYSIQCPTRSLENMF